jgi:hypothetical protein
MGGWMGGWMDGWMEGKAGLRIAYSNQKNLIIHRWSNYSKKIKKKIQSKGYKKFNLWLLCGTFKFRQVYIVGGCMGVSVF